jgi:nucleotide-binding universal stress UspA family protein
MADDCRLRREAAMFKQIIVALKFGAASLQALKKGIELAKAHGAELHIFHAMDYALKQTDHADQKLIAVRQEVEKRFEAEVKPLLADFKQVRFTCLPEDPALAVCKAARDTGADLIVMGCHQLPEKMCLGRIDYVGMTILEKAPCPIMLVPLCE